MTNGNPFKCLACGGSPLQRDRDAYACLRCKAEYEIRYGVPIFLKGMEVAPSGCSLSKETALQICDLTSLPRDERTVCSLQQIFSHTYHFSDGVLAAENNYFFNRVSLPEPMKRPPPTATAPGRPVNRDIRYSIVHHFVPDFLPRDKLIIRNVRLLNTGTSVISSKTSEPACLSYHWFDTSGQVVEYEGERTVLPIDLVPGRAVTVPSCIRTPRRPGNYMLTLTLVHEGIAWLDDDSLTIGVQIIEDGEERTPAHWVQTDKLAESYDYQEDHSLGRAMLFEEIERWQRPLTLPSPPSRGGEGRVRGRILEVGGCCSPMTRGLPFEIYSADIDVQTLQVGQLSLADGSEQLQFICADVNDPPFCDHSFDCIVLFSTLHHLPNPLEALIKLKRLMKRDGFLAVMCEPVGYYLDGQASEEFLRELEQGINEQIYTPEEYNHMFLRAGLYSQKVVMDRGSFKAILRAQPG